jgi:predicted acyl esterase
MGASPDGSQFQLVRWRIGRFVRPAMRVTPPPAGVRFERDVEVPVRDGTILRVNVFRPADDDADDNDADAERPTPRPVLLCAHPYGKDGLPKPKRGGRGYRVPRQVRLLTQSEDYEVSAWTSWEAPDPGFWVPRGYVLVNADLRGWGASDGVGELLSEQEALDVHDLVEWAAAQPWSNGKVGMTGVSYLAIMQWAVASTRPPHLAAINPWEGFTDAYRDFLRPGGVREDGFAVMWTKILRLLRRSPVDLRRQQKRRLLYDDWYAARDRDLEAIEVPALVAASFSDHDLHSRGSFEGFRRIGSVDKWLYTHRGPKWSIYYGADAKAAQVKFFDAFLRDNDNNAMLDEPRVRLEVRDTRTEIRAVHDEGTWPPTGLTRTELNLDPAHGRLVAEPPDTASLVSFDLRKGQVSFDHRFSADTEVIGSLWLRLQVSLAAGGDASLFARIQKVRDGRVVGFEGSYGFIAAPVTHGWQKVSHRQLDPERSTDDRPFHTHAVEEPVAPGEVVVVDVELLPSATSFRRGDELHLDLRGRWFLSRNPLLGQFPVGYESSAPGTCTIHAGPEHRSSLTLPTRVSETR